MKKQVLETSDKIRFDKNLGVYRTYKGYKYQPGIVYAYIAPGKRAPRFVCADSLEAFQSLVDRGAI